MIDQKAMQKHGIKSGNKTGGIQHKAKWRLTLLIAAFGKYILSLCLDNIWRIVSVTFSGQAHFYRDSVKAAVEKWPLSFIRSTLWYDRHYYYTQ